MRFPPSNDSDLRALFEDAVSDVHPQGGTGEIRARAGRPTTSRWVPLTIAAAVATVLVITGAAWLAQRQPSDTPAAGGTAQKGESAGETSPQQGRTVEVPVYYVGSTAAGPRLFAETHEVTDTTESELQVAVQEALRGDPIDPDYSPAFRNATSSARASTDGETITIDLSDDLGVDVDMPDESGTAGVQALVWTAQAATASEQPVRFTIDGKPADRVYNVDTSAPVQRASADSMLSTVSIATPTEGAVVPSRFEVTGQAATFEANVVWELKRGDEVVRNGFTTARECCTQSPYSFSVTAPPGDYTLVVRDTDESDGEGIGTSADTKRITVE
jgi:spore germination protein GerM